MLKINQEKIISVFVVLFFMASFFTFNALSDDKIKLVDQVKRFELKIIERKLQQEKNIIQVIQGEKLELIWTTDEKAKLHIHGYNIEFEISPEAPKTISFKANATGRFAITSHSFGHGHGSESSPSHKALLYIEVYPK